MHMELGSGILILRRKAKTSGAVDYFKATLRNNFAGLGVAPRGGGVLHLDALAER
jgi:hypothetical protein